MDNAAALETFFFDKLSQNLEVRSIEGKARLSNLAKPLIRQLPRGIYGQLMLDRLAEILGVTSESLDRLLEAAPAPPERYADSPPQHAPPPFYPHRRGRYPDSSVIKLSAYRKPASLKAIELLLRNPEIALSITTDLEPLRSAEDESRKLLLALIEMVRKDPNTETYTLLGYCYGTNLGSQLTQVLQSERITPQEGVEEEFHHILDNILSDIVKKLELLQLRDELKSRVSAAKDRN